ncbi:hypothetical protein GCM10023329_52890 [Streptomyces sanyensis]|uniref:Uncharacterized protein n=1 Tax=Streptomyces sanyensis TaxID=568869 RepID=A0ABP9BGS7_9ACTN
MLYPLSYEGRGPWVPGRAVGIFGGETGPVVRRWGGGLPGMPRAGTAGITGRPTDSVADAVCRHGASCPPMSGGGAPAAQKVAEDCRDSAVMHDTGM